MRVYSLEVGRLARAKRAESLPQAPPPSAPPHLSIVVLPFANLGGDPEQEFFVDGVTESLTADLSRIAGSFVIGRNTAFTYKGKAVDLKQIGRELGVRYALEGSVQRGGNRMRVNVQLINSDTGAHLWAERFDNPVADLFEMQDEIVARLANALNAQMVAAEARRAEQSPHPDSMDLYFQGLAWFNKGPSSENLARSRGFLERAVALDPNNIDALVWIAQLDVVRGAGLMSADRTARLASAEDAAAKALSLAPITPQPICAWEWSKTSPTAPPRAFTNASWRWPSIEIWPAPTEISASRRMPLVSRRRLKHIFSRRSASLLGIHLLMSGASLPAWPSSISEEMKRRSLGCGAASSSTEIMPLGNSVLRPLWPNAASWTKQEPQQEGVGARSDLHPRSFPRQRIERQSGLSRRTRTRDRGHA